MIKIGYTAILALSVLLLPNACSKSHQQEQKAPTKRVIVKKTFVTLPDTAYPSVQSVRWSVDLADSLPQDINGYTNYYNGKDVLTFRKTLLRDADFHGTVSGSPDTIEVAWRFDTEYNKEKTKYGIWGGGSGWTGQPLYLSKINEIVVGSLAGKVYFIDFATGKASRDPLDATNTIKGTVSKDPVLNNLYVGQGVPNHQPFGNMVFDLNKHQLTCFNGRDPKALRGWNAWDSSPVVVGGYLFWPGENGSVYKYRRTQGKITPAAVLRYTVNGCAPGIENSLCVYANYGFFGDNHGNILCINLNNMHPIWYYDNYDDIDATIACEPQKGVPYIYVASEVDKQGMTGVAHLAKLNGLNGKCVWKRDFPCKRLTIGSKTLDGGFYATPLLGKGDCKDMLFANICRNGDWGGQMLAISKRDGTVSHTTQLNQFAWSSPVAFYNEHHQMYILTGDSGGYIYLIKGKTGEIIYKKRIAYNFESSPVVIGNTAVVGSRQNGIFKLVVK